MTGITLFLNEEPFMGIVDDVRQHLGPGEIQQLAQQIGADPAQTQTAIQAALPMLLGGVASTAQQPGGATTVQEAMATHQNLLGGLGNLGSLGGLGGALGGLLGGAQLGDGGGGGLLGSILGSHQSTVQNGVQQASGLDSSQTRRLLMVLAPIVLAMLAKRHANASQADVGAAIQKEAQDAHAEAQRTSPQVGGLLGKILSYVETPRA